MWVFKNRWHKIFFGALALFLVAGTGKLALAQFEGEGLTISPPISEFTIEAGQTVSKTIKLTNPTKNLVEVYPTTMDFKSKGEGGEPAFIQEEDQNTKFSLSKWISFTQSKVALTPEQVVEFTYKISVPQDAEPGGHYGAVFFVSQPPKAEPDKTQVSVSSMIGSLLLVKVPGDIKEQAKVKEFGTDRRLYLFNKVKFLTRVENTGNIHIKPKGEISIKGLFGEKSTITVNEQKGNVLPESIRKFENEWNKSAILIGPYTAKLGLTYGEEGKQLADEITFWIIPWWFIVAIAVLVLLIIFLLWRRRRKRNRPVL